MKLLAFSISVPLQPEFGCELVFAQDATEAIHEAKAFDSQLWEDGDASFEVRRHPEFDSEAPGPVPASVLLEAGWSLDLEDLGQDVLEFLKKREGR